VTVAFVVDGGPERGTGHIYETITLAGDIPSDASRIAFVETEGLALEMLRDAGVPAEPFSEADDLVARLSALAPSAVVFDHPDLSERLLAAVANVDAIDRVVAIGNTLTNIPATAGDYCDVVVNYSKDVTTFESQRRRAGDTLFLEGPAYFIVRSSFDRYRDAWAPVDDFSGGDDRARSEHPVSDVLLLFGGSDPSNYTTKISRRLLASDNQYDLDLVLGPGFEHESTLRDEIAACDRRDYTIRRDVDDVGRLMVSTDVLLTSPGLTTFEAIYVGCPLAAICQTPAHTKAYRSVEFAYEYDDIDDADQLLAETFDRFTGEFSTQLEVGTRRDEIVDAILPRT
jgi:spore coat polysaccharide biosynthesis predicted glycosyltransferase SpsG